MAVWLSGGAHADTVTVAVASNFARTAEVLVVQFQARSGHDVRLVRGSSGKLFAQIVNGAPIDVFLSADVERPQALASRGLAAADSRFTYAIGQLVVWSRDPEFAGKDCRQALRTTQKKIAIANPRLAPYGAAAKQALQRDQLWDDIQGRIVFGENIAQTLQFAATGGAGAAFVARSQLDADSVPDASCSAPVPADLHAPIAQQAVVLRRAERNPAARSFATFLASDAARRTIASHGYALASTERASP